MQVRGLSSLAFWIVLLVLRVWLIPRLSKRWVHPVEGRRPERVDIWFAQFPASQIALLVLAVVTILAFFHNPLWFLVSGSLASMVGRSPWYFVAGAVAAVVPHPEANRLDLASLAIAASFFGDGAARLIAPRVVPVPTVRPEKELIDDLLRLLALTKGADVRWLEESSGLASAEQMRTTLGRLESSGWLVKNGGSVELAPAGEREVYAAQGWRIPITPL